ncbi:MAG: protoheme IX farnesyltransferase [Bacteroidota bacterium]
MRNNRFVRKSAAYLKLGKATISLPVALTALLGHVLYRSGLNPDSLLVVAGVFLLSLGSASINQIQERKTDALMPRTRNRPLPAGILSLPEAVVFAVLCLSAGTLLLILSGPLLAALLGLFTAGWYNLVYTPLKRKSAFAVLPGALIGALPPLIGWSAAGGNLFHPTILMVSFFLFMGQMPHYWLLLIRIGGEFSQAGLPVITDRFSASQIRNLSFVWITAATVTVLVFPVTGVLLHQGASLLLVSASLLFIVRMFVYTYRDELFQKWKNAFITVNLFYLFIILILLADRLWPDGEILISLH